MVFKLLQKEYLSDIDTTAFLYEHNKTKARLLFFKNKDENKSFSITFKTIPYSDNGIFHILEHSVLCGSEKYPVKEPFVELIKGSFNTFINAMTFPDKTMYPVSSKNDKDLSILMDVYLDAVFNPKLLKNDKILKQEGWHYHLEDKNDELVYNGVVYNEMKGVYSSDSEIVDMHISENLHPDTEYRFSHGGKPESITSITQEEFIKTHSFCYHPSNSYIFLYGDIDDIESYLMQIDNYLKEYAYIDYSNYQTSLQTKIENKVVNKTYAIPNHKNKNYVSINYILGKNSDLDIINAVNIIDELLLGNPNSPFRKHFIDNNICEDVYSYMNRDKKQVSFSIIFKNVKDEYLEELGSIYLEKLKEHIDNKFDTEQIESIINKQIFSIKEEVNKTSSPKGINYAIRALRNWIYDENPLELFYYSNIIDKMKTNLSQNNFEDIAIDYLLDNELMVIINLRAIEKTEDTSKDILDKSVFSETELKTFVESTLELLEWQNYKDSKDDLEKIRSVNATDVILNKPFKEIDVIVRDDVSYAHYNVHTSDILYSRLFFNISSFSEEELQYASLLTYLLFNVRTENISELGLQTYIDNNLGDIYSNINIYKDDISNKTKVKFVIAAKNLNSKTKDLVDILTETTLNSKFSNKETVQSIILELKISLEDRFKDAGHSFVLKRLSSYMSLSNKLSELITGYDFYIFLNNILDNFDENYSILEKKLTNVYKSIFKKNNLLINYTCNDSDKKIFEKEITRYIEKLDNGTTISEYTQIDFKKKEENYSELFHLDTQVNYVAIAFDQLPYYNGSLLVLRHILNLDYLWNEVRVKGGAYGTGLNINKYGEVVFWSYRDPNIEKTLDVYNSVSKYIRRLNIDSRELNKYIIGTLNSFNQLLSPNEKSSLSINSYITNSNPEFYNKIVEEIKNTTLDDLLKFAELFEKKKYYTCLLTSSSIVEDFKDKFTKVVELK